MDPSLWDDVPTHDDPHSVAAAVGAARSAKGQRRAILAHIVRTGPATCSELHYIHPTRKHQSISASLTVLRSHKVIWKVGERRNEEGNLEWVCDITAPVRSHLGLPPGLPEWRKPPR